MKHLLALVAVSAIAVACSGSGPAASATSTTVGATATPGATLEPAPDDTSSPADGPTSAKLGEAVRITCDGQDCMDVSVLKAQVAARYRDPQGYLDDVPDHKGDVFIAVEVRYVAVGAKADYNPYDWALYVGDEQVQDTAYASNGPKPMLGANDLPKGKKVAGWIVWEIPKTGKITISYEPGSNGSIFEVVLRSK